MDGDRVRSVTTNTHGTVKRQYTRADVGNDPIACEVLWDTTPNEATNYVYNSRLEPITHNFVDEPLISKIDHPTCHDGKSDGWILQVGENPKDRIGATKPDLSLVPPAAQIGLAQAMKNGADKYGAYNWRTKKVQAMTYLAAAQRHILQYLDGEEVAEDSGVHHLAHAAACMGILLDAIATGNLVDNRPPVGAASKLIKEGTVTP